MGLKHSSSLWAWICLFISICLVSSVCGGRNLLQTNVSNFQLLKAVNLGGWLVTEGWMKPSLFDAIPNKDLLDGTGLQFKSVTTGKYLCAERGGGTIIVANHTPASTWETFKLWRIDQNTFQLRVNSKQFMGLDMAGNKINIVAVANTPGASETFQIVRKSDNPNRVRIKAPNGFFLQAKTEVLVTADGNVDTQWGNNDPSVFDLTIAYTLRGEYQVTNGYGPNATRVITDHWNTFIVEDDFKFMAANGLNAVRIPVGWWIASDPTPPKPYVGGGLKVLDNALLWAGKYNLKVIITLHAAPGSQNGQEHSSPRDGYLEWGNPNIDQTVAVIEFLTTRYANSPSLYGMEFLNEPHAPGVSLDTLNKYYTSAYQAVRRHSSTVYAVLSNRLFISDQKELFPVAKTMTKAVVDVHAYNLYSLNFIGTSAQQNIDYINNTRAAELSSLITSDGPLIFVGEWVAEWQVIGATMMDYQRFAAVQIQVYGRSTFGWAYWSFKNVQNHWSMQWMIQNGYIKL